MDTPGPHRHLLDETPFDLITARGPFSARELVDLIEDDGPFDAILCGEDEFNAEVISHLSPRTRIISKYGVGLDKIDSEAARRANIRVTNTAGVNHSSVAELTFGLLLTAVRRIADHNYFVHDGQWKRFTGVELAGKTLGLCGMGRVGKEVAKRALAFGMRVKMYNTSWSVAHQQLLQELNLVFSHGVFRDPLFTNGALDSGPVAERASSLEELLSSSDVISLHMNLTKDNTGFLNRRTLPLSKRGVFIVNVSRGALVDSAAMLDALNRGHVAAYATDVLDIEPIPTDHPLRGHPRVIITPHIGSRTVESVARQGLAALRNVLELFPECDGPKVRAANS